MSIPMTSCDMGIKWGSLFSPTSLQAAISQSQMDDDALEELSFTREPKQKDAVNNGVKPESDLPKFSEWVSGQATQLDTQTITSHVKLMVDVRVCVCVCVCVCVFVCVCLCVCVCVCVFV